MPKGTRHATGNVGHLASPQRHEAPKPALSSCAKFERWDFTILQFYVLLLFLPNCTAACHFLLFTSSFTEKLHSDCFSWVSLFCRSIFFFGLLHNMDFTLGTKQIHHFNNRKYYSIFHCSLLNLFCHSQHEKQFQTSQ